jgi:hypothetical protein
MPKSEPILDPADKELFLKVWGLTEESMSGEEIRMAIALGHF